MDEEYIVIEYFIDGKFIQIDEINEVFGIKPTRFRTDDDWPEVIKNNANLPEHLKPKGIFF